MKPPARRTPRANGQTRKERAQQLLEEHKQELAAKMMQCVKDGAEERHLPSLQELEDKWKALTIDSFKIKGQPQRQESQVDKEQFEKLLSQQIKQLKSLEEEKNSIEETQAKILLIQYKFDQQNAVLAVQGFPVFESWAGVQYQIEYHGSRLKCMHEWIKMMENMAKEDILKHREALQLCTDLLEVEYKELGHRQQAEFMSLQIGELVLEGAKKKNPQHGAQSKMRFYIQMALHINKKEELQKKALLVYGKLNTIGAKLYQDETKEYVFKLLQKYSEGKNYKSNDDNN